MDGLTSTPAQRGLARLSFVLAGLVIVILLVFAGLKSLATVAVGLAAVVVSLAAAYFLPGALRVWVPRDRPGVWCRSRRGTGPGCGTSPAFRNVRRGHRIDRR